MASYKVNFGDVGAVYYTEQTGFWFMLDIYRCVNGIDLLISLSMKVANKKANS